LTSVTLTSLSSLAAGQAGPAEQAAGLLDALQALQPFPRQAGLVAAEDENEFVGALDPDTLPALPAQGTWLEKDEVYSHDGGAVMVRQSHYRTEHDPADVPALFVVYRADAEGLDWIAGEPVEVGYVRVYDGVTYRCIQAHVTQADWTPPVVPALWAVYSTEPPTDEWAPGVSYTIGDIVTYSGAEYECRQSHTSQVGWEPPNVLALWLPL
jgi:hypothetical protein